MITEVKLTTVKIDHKISTRLYDSSDKNEVDRLVGVDDFFEMPKLG